MSYWITSIGLIAFGVVGMFGIGRPFLLVGLAMLALGRLRSRPARFWPPFAAVIAWNVGFLVIAPSNCTATQTIGGDLTVSGDLRRSHGLPRGRPQLARVVYLPESLLLWWSPQRRCLSSASS